MGSVTAGSRGWTFLSNHGHVLVCLARDPEVRLRDVADLVGITERAAQTIVRDLEESGYVRKQRVGRRNTYSIIGRSRFRHPLEAGVRIRDFLDLVAAATPAGARPRRTSA